MNPGYAFVAVTVACTVYGQMIFKWQVGKAGQIPGGFGPRVDYFAHFLINPWVITSLASAVVAAFAWIVALSRLDLSRAYPFVSASFALVLVLSMVVFNESMTLPKIVGAVLIVAGLVVGSQA
jgi:multidrug transporter EmrE-like cation transporter